MKIYEIDTKYFNKEIPKGNTVVRVIEISELKKEIELMRIKEPENKEELEYDNALDDVYDLLYSSEQKEGFIDTKSDTTSFISPSVSGESAREDEAHQNGSTSSLAHNQKKCTCERRIVDFYINNKEINVKCSGCGGVL